MQPLNPEVCCSKLQLLTFISDLSVYWLGMSHVKVEHPQMYVTYVPPFPVSRQLPGCRGRHLSPQAVTSGYKMFKM